MKKSLFSLRLPHWLAAYESHSGSHFPDILQRMRFVIELSRRSIDEEGGPFAAAIFRIDDGALLASGVNLVIAGRCSLLHAEIVALMRAQLKAGSHDLSAAGLPPCELVTSTEPCAMCLGAIAWSGVRGLVCGARGEDAESIGFDEGEKPPRWQESLERRGISVRENVLREEAADVLWEYRAGGGRIYNPERCAHR
ncbi:MAG: nucleoside deaminase [Geobacteraceae bacterium]|nr:nucleoside deaminase [Geobacteraceae bacterium]